MVKNVFEDFTVFEEDKNHVFIHINLQDNEMFYVNLFDFFFSEDRLLKYCENKKHIQFVPSRKAYTILYRHLRNYIDEENEIIDFPVLSDEIEKILETEDLITYENGKRIARADKIGKIGEYIFNCILNEYFNFDCIIPKVHLQTDYNMNVFGIDSLFYSSQKSMIMFGESKFSMSLDNGIGLIKKSLEDYEKQISDEYELVLSNRFYGEQLNVFAGLYGEYTETCVNIQEFITEAKIKTIGIPIFIAHGTETDSVAIMQKLKKIPRSDLLGLDTIYYCISLPVVDKYKAVSLFIKKIRETEDRYNAARK